MGPPFFLILSQINPAETLPFYCLNNVSYLLKARTMKPEKQPLQDNDCVTSSNGVILEAVFSVRSVPTLYNEDNLPLRDSPETAVKRIGIWCEMAASMRGHERGSIGTSTVGRCYQAAQ
jgi:hypothetical protein